MSPLKQCGDFNFHALIHMDRAENFCVVRVCCHLVFNHISSLVQGPSKDSYYFLYRYTVKLQGFCHCPDVEACLGLFSQVKTEASVMFSTG